MLLYSCLPMEASPLVSIVIPAYNEARRITQTLETIRLYLSKIQQPAEVIVVNDGSQDATVPIVQKLCDSWDQLHLIQNPGNCGKGFSVKNGALAAKGEIVLFTDADLSAPISEMPKLLNPIRSGECDVSFGSRGLDRSLIGVHQSKLREVSGRIYNLFMRLLTGLRFKDTQCGFKAFRREPLIPVFQQQRITGFGFDPEMLYIAQKSGLRLKEVPVRWDHAEGTTVRFIRDPLLMFLGLMKIRWNHLTGKYRY
jgi:glycosyltransferase involved in cell wall biosynthesis